MPEQFVFDSRLPVSGNQSDSDPNHPKNVMRRTQMVSAQATADTKYDISPPPRVEAAAEPTTEPFIDLGNDTPLFYVCVIAAIGSIALLLSPKPTLLRYGLIGIAIVSLHCAVSIMDKRNIAW